MLRPHAVWLIPTQVGHQVRVGTSTAGLNAPTKRIHTLSREVKLRRSLRLLPVSPVSLVEARVNVRLPSDGLLSISPDHGFRYVAVRGLPAGFKFTKDMLTAHFCHSDLPRVASLELPEVAATTDLATPNILNEIYHVTLCAQMSQLWSIPTGEISTVCVVLLPSGINIQFVCNAFAPNRLPAA